MGLDQLTARLGVVDALECRLSGLRAHQRARDTGAWRSSSSPNGASWCLSILRPAQALRAWFRGPARGQPEAEPMPSWRRTRHSLTARLNLIRTPDLGGRPRSGWGGRNWTNHLDDRANTDPATYVLVVPLGGS